MIAEMRGEPPRPSSALALQWGRDQMIAEIAPERSREPLAVVLQWGRDQMIAEIRGRSTLSAGSAVASMGPRSNDRGNDLQYQRVERSALRLQWGRDQMIAEIHGSYDARVDD